MRERKKNPLPQKTLFERERGCRILSLSPTEAAEFEELEKLGVANAASSSYPDDYKWDGGKNKIDAELIIASGLGARSVEDERLLAIIDERTNDQNRKPNQAQKKSEREYRLEQIKKHLSGKPAPRGRPKPDYEPVLSAVAKRFHRAYFGFEDSVANLTQLLSTVIWPDDQGKSLDPETKSDRLKPYRREWKAHRDRLLLRLTEDGAALAGGRPQIAK